MATKLAEVSADPEVLPRPRPTRLPNAPPSRGRTLLEQHFPRIRQTLDRLSRRSGLPDHEAEEFRSWALFKLVENDYRILGRWEGRSSFPTFLTVVLVNLVRDYRSHVWGKWRPSATARRRGPEAVLLERLCQRDGLPLAAAIETMRNEHGISLSRAELEGLAASPRRSPERRWVSDEVLLQIRVDGQVERRIEDGERAMVEERLRRLLAPLLQSLTDQERLLLELHYWEGLSVAAISPLLGRPQRGLYSARDRCLRKLRQSLEDAGFSAEELRVLLG